MHNQDDSISFHIQGNTGAIKEIGEIFQIEHQLKYVIYEMEFESNDEILTDKERPYPKIAANTRYLAASESDFSAFLLFEPKTVVVILLKTKRWEKYNDKILEVFKWEKQKSFIKAKNSNNVKYK